MVERAADMVNAMVPKVQKKYAAALQQQQFLQQHSGQSVPTADGAGSSSSGSSGTEGLSFSRDQVRHYPSFIHPLLPHPIFCSSIHWYITLSDQLYNPPRTNLTCHQHPL